MVARIHYRWDFIGLSTDNKPTPETSEKVVDGSTYYCSDNSKLYVWYKTQWYERKPLGGGGGGGSYIAGTGIDITDDTISVDTTTIQPKLTAGDNITITDDTISATDTTYSNFTGTDGTAAGTAGLVPAPTTSDADKYLKSDGSWATVSGGGGTTYTAGDGIDITNAVISATNTGKARVLTTDDYNYHYTGDSDNGIALWLLDEGLYKLGALMYIYENTTEFIQMATNTSFLVLKYGAIAPASRRTMVLIQDQTSSEPHLIVFKTANGELVYSSQITTVADIIDNLTSSSTDKSLSANQGKVLKDLIDSIAIRASGAPTTSTVGSVGTLYEDTTNGKLYQCTDTTGGTYTWVEVGAGGSAPTVVQTTGTSTTDVMSQNAVTSMIYADPTTMYKVKIGSNAQNNGVNTVVIGSSAQAGANRAIAIGASCYAVPLSSVAIGFGALATTQGQFDIGEHSGASSGYNSSVYRLLTGLYDGQSDHDAATVGQIKMGTLSATPTGTTAGMPGRLYTYDSGGGTYEVYLCVHDNGDDTYVWKQVSLI